VARPRTVDRARTGKESRDYLVAGGFAGAAGAGVAGACDVGAGVCDAGAGAAGLGLAGALCDAGSFTPPTTDEGPRCQTMPRPIAPSMKSTAATVVTRVSSVAPARTPKAAWLLDPPNALAMSPPLPCWSSTTSSSTTQMMT